MLFGDISEMRTYIPCGGAKSRFLASPPIRWDHFTYRPLGPLPLLGQTLLAGRHIVPNHAGQAMFVF